MWVTFLLLLIMCVVAAQPPGDELFCPKGCCLLSNQKHAKIEGRPSIHYRCVQKMRHDEVCGWPSYLSIDATSEEVRHMLDRGMTQDVCVESTRPSSALYISKLFM